MSNLILCRKCNSAYPTIAAYRGHSCDLVEEKITPTNIQSAAIAQIADRVIALRNKVHITRFNEVRSELLEIGQQLRTL